MGPGRLQGPGRAPAPGGGAPDSSSAPPAGQQDAGRGGPVCEASLTAAANVRELRAARGWSQHRLAAQTGLSPAMVSHLEAGKRNFTLPMLERVAAALERGARDLLAPRPGGGG
jgi:DNA-binding Xre family transcriptional regulator